jgi:hypothetical protein
MSTHNDNENEDLASALGGFIDRVKKDAARLDWLEKTQTSIGYNVERSKWGVDFEAPYGTTIREAIDAAMDSANI